MFLLYAVAYMQNNWLQLPAEFSIASYISHSLDASSVLQVSVITAKNWGSSSLFKPVDTDQSTNCMVTPRQPWIPKSSK